MRFLFLSLLCWFFFLPLKAKGDFMTSIIGSTTQQDTRSIPPSKLRCGDGKLGYGLYWMDNSTNEIKFTVYRTVNSANGFSVCFEVKSNTLTTTGSEYFCKIDYKPENFYFYKVVAVDKSGKISSSELITLPKRPVGLAVKTDSVSAILTWSYPVDNLVNFVFIERSIKPSDEFQIMSPVVNQGGVTYVDYSAEPGIDYYYRIRGVTYDSKSKITSYTIPTEAIGPVKISNSGKDYDGLVNFNGRDYKYKTFLNQTWMIENLAYLPEVYPATSISASEKRYYIYGYQGSDLTEAMKTENYKIYGVLYNWTAASDGVEISSADLVGVQGICPTGWHLPSNKEWVDLWNNLNKVQTANHKAIVADAMAKGARVYDSVQFIGDFASPDFNPFKVAPGGFLLNDSMKFYSVGEVENYWSSTSRILADKGIRVSNAGKESGFPVRCIKGPALPRVTTVETADITETTAKPGGTVLGDGGAVVTARGICWNTIGMPTITDHLATTGDGIGVFNGVLSGLIAGTTYYIRAYATNIVGTAYGAQKWFKTGGNGAVPSVLTVQYADILGTSASVSGIISAFGGDSILAQGVCWSPKKKPTVTNSIVIDRSGKLNFTGYLAGLTPLTTYYSRAFATNKYGTGYGEEKQFITAAGVPDGTFAYEGRTYAYTTIGTQTWMSENLAYLPSVSPVTVGSNDKPYYYVYGYEGYNIDSAKATANYSMYGVLFNWNAATTACPPGWHLPGQGEMTLLTEYLTNYGYGRGGFGNRIAKSMASTTGWEPSIYPGTLGNDPATNNRSGFNAIPGGQCYSLPVGKATNIGKGAIFWSATANMRDPSYAYALVLFYSKDNANPYPNADKKNGFSVRCLKDK